MSFVAGCGHRCDRGFRYCFSWLVPKARALVLGERGELVVAEQLEELRADGFRCFHDIVQNGFNIDHVVVGPPECS